MYLQSQRTTVFDDRVSWKVKAPTCFIAAQMYGNDANARSEDMSPQIQGLSQAQRVATWTDLETRAEMDSISGYDNPIRPGKHFKGPTSC